MPDFGKAGTRTVRNNADAGAVVVHIGNGEYLSFKLSVQGAEPIFTFACKHRALLSAHQVQGHPKQVYEWTWSRNGDESDDSDDTYVLSMLFIRAVKYTLTVEHRRQNNDLISTLKDIEYASQEPSDHFTEILEILTA